MSNVISFLESVGKDATLRHAAKGEIELLLTQTQIDPELRTALVSGDQARLQALLGAKTNVVCAIMPGKEEDEEETPSKDDDEITAKVALNNVAAG